jgi:hypothetical protein
MSENVIFILKIVADIQQQDTYCHNKTHKTGTISAYASSKNAEGYNFA